MLLIERLLLVKHRSSLGFVPRELMSLGAERCQSAAGAAAQLEITGHHQQHLLTWIRCQDKQTNNVPLVCRHWIFYWFLSQNAQ